MAIGIAIPFSPLGDYLGFTALPPLYWPLLALTLLCYVLLTQVRQDVAAAEEVDLTGSRFEFAAGWKLQSDGGRRSREQRWGA